VNFMSSDDRANLDARTGNPGDRRGDRRKRTIPVALDRRKENSAQKRETSGRRRQVDPTTCERDYNEDEIEFMKAMDRYKRDNRRPFPTWSEVLEVLSALGYRKVAEPTALPGLQPSLAGTPVPPKG
jgi:hypothetical protein